MVKILPEIWPSHRISNNLKLLTYTQYTTLTYTSSHTHQHRRRREITKLRNKKTQIQFSICQREDKNKYIHTHTQDTYKRGGYTSLHIYIERKKEIYIKLV